MSKFIKTITSIFGGGTGDLVNTIGDVADKFITTKQEKAEFQAAIMEAARNHELELQAKALDAFEAEVKDRDSARSREVEIAKAGRFDFMMILTGIIGLAAFCFMLYALAFLEIPPNNKELFIHSIGIIEGVVLSIFAYYFGTSKSSSDKTKMLANGKGN